MRPAKAERLAACWQAFDGQKFCDGNAVQHEVVLNLPITLIIEMGDISSGNNWEIPKTLSPYPNNSTATAHGVKYSVVGHIYLSPGGHHFIARYFSASGAKPRIFDHDGGKREGHVILRDGAVKGLLSGQSDTLRDIPAGFFLNAVVYHLDGGQSAQSFFQKQQIELAKKLSLYFEPTSGTPSTCELRRPNLEIITATDRWWLPHGSSTVDYRIPQKSPQKSPTKKWHPPMV